MKPGFLYNCYNHPNCLKMYPGDWDDYNFMECFEKDSLDGWVHWDGLNFYHLKMFWDISGTWDDLTWNTGFAVHLTCLVKKTLLEVV